MGALLNDLPDRAWRLVQRELGLPARARGTSCLFFAQVASSALRGLGQGWRFRAGGAFLPSSEMTGWGLAVSPRDRTFHVYADLAVNQEDGSYCGHCWVETGGRWSRRVVDIMEPYAGAAQAELASGYVVYHPLPTLSTSVRAYHQARLRRVARATTRDRELVSAVRAVAEEVTSDQA